MHVKLVGMRKWRAFGIWRDKAGRGAGFGENRQYMYTVSSRIGIALAIPCSDKCHERKRKMRK